MSTIRDIARQAGVSVSTASLALNDDARVRPQTRQRVQQVAQQLNYHPLRAARSLSSGRTYSLHLLNPVSDTALSSGFFLRFAHGVHDIARRHRYSVALTILDDAAEAEKVLERLIFERWSDGVIVINPAHNEALLARLRAASFPHVLLGRSEPAAALSVDNDNIAVARDATTHLLERRRDPVLLLNGPARQTFTQERAEGYRLAHQQTGRNADPALQAFSAGTIEAAQQLIREHLDAGTHFGSVLAVSDTLALGAMRTLQEHGIAIPNEVAVVGMNNDDLAAYTRPSLTSVELNALQLGREAASLLLEAIRGEPSQPPRRIVPHSLVARESS